MGEQRRLLVSGGPVLPVKVHSSGPGNTAAMDMGVHQRVLDGWSTAVMNIQTESACESCEHPYRCPNTRESLSSATSCVCNRGRTSWMRGVHGVSALPLDPPEASDGRTRGYRRLD